jgi:type I restriction enzyme, S subunit
MQQFKQSEVGMIPDDWDVKVVSNVATAVASGTSSDYSEFGDFPVYGSTGMIGTSLKPDYTGWAILIARVGANAGKISIVDGDYGVTDNTIIVRLNNTVDRSYFWRQLEAKRLNTLVFGSGQPLITGTQIKSLLLPYPPEKEEQEAIAAALSDSDVYIESLRQLIAKKRAVKQGAMQALLTGESRLSGFQKKSGFKQSLVGLIPEDWDVVRAVDACSKIQDGTHFSPHVGGADYLYVTSKNIRFGYLDLSTAGHIDRDQHRAIYLRCDVKKGDLLLTKDGANTGNAALNTLDEEISLLSSVAFLRFLPKEHSSKYFLQQILSSYGQRQIQEAMTGNAITRLTLEKINNLLFPVPPSLSEQIAIACILSDMDAEVAELEVKLDKARDIKQGMAQTLLTGRIRLL